MTSPGAGPGSPPFQRPESRTMSLAPTSTSPSRAARLTAAAAGVALLAALSACGGGGGDSAPAATVSSATISAGRFGSSAFVQVSGTHLDDGLTVSSDECTGLTRLTQAPYVSTSTIAYYSCTVARMSGSVEFRQRGSGAVLRTTTFTVTDLPQVQITLAGPVPGIITVDLAADKAPDTVVNYLRYVNAQRYNGVIFHRVAVPTGLYPLGIVQGGGYGATQSTNLGNHIAVYDPIALEIDTSLHNTPGSIAMARAAALDSATSEFYFNVQDNSAFLDGSYAVFGQVHSDADLARLEAIQGTQCTLLPGLPDGSCVPIPNVVMQSVVQVR